MPSTLDGSMKDKLLVLDGVFFPQVKEIRRSSPLASLTPTELRARWS